MLISCTVTAQLICAFVFAYAKSSFSHVEAHFVYMCDKVICFVMYADLYIIAVNASVFTFMYMGS